MNYSKYIVSFFSLLMLFSVSIGFVSCSSDDDDDNGGGSASSANSEITTNDGEKVRLSQVGYLRFYYDEKGRPESISHSGDFISIDYAKGTIEDDSEEVTYKFCLNGSGFISSISGSYDEEGGDYKEKGSGSASYSYDGNGRLTKYSDKGSYSGMEDGEKYSGSYTSTTTLSYDNGKLMKVVASYTEIEDGEKWSGKAICTMEYDDGVMNTLGQHTFGNYYALMEAEIAGAELYLVGLLGRPSSCLPSKISIQFIYDDDDYTNSKNVSYSFNSDGTLNSEWGFNTVSYSYNDIPSAAKSVMAPAPLIRNSVRTNIERIHKVKGTRLLMPHGRANR